MAAASTPNKGGTDRLQDMLTRLSPADKSKLSVCSVGSVINTTLLQYDLPCGFISACATDGCLQHVFDACVVLLLADWVKLPAVCC